MVRKQFSRKQLLLFTSNKPAMLIGIEACGGAHFLARTLEAQGHDSRLIPAQYVKPYVKTNKNDYLDAEAIAEAVTSPNMRFVPIKTDAQLDLQSLHRVRDRWVGRRTTVANQIRGLLASILEDAEARLSAGLRELLVDLKNKLEFLNQNDRITASRPIVKSS